MNHLSFENSWEWPIDCPRLEWLDYGFNLTRKKLHEISGEADPIVTQMAWGPVIEKVYVFEGVHFDEMKALSDPVQ